VCLDVSGLDSRDAGHNEEKLMNCFEVHGLLEEYVKENWVPLAAVVANAMIGKHCHSEQAKSEVPLYFALAWSWIGIIGF
jgi:hypothetical protein